MWAWRVWVLQTSCLFQPSYYLLLFLLNKLKLTRVISFGLGPRGLLEMFFTSVLHCLQCSSHAVSATSSSNLSTPSRATHSVFTSNLFLFRSIVDEVPARAARGRTEVHEVSHSSGLEHAKRKVETSGPAPIVVELGQTVN